jgi:hypothetical protein
MFLHCVCTSVYLCVCAVGLLACDSPLVMGGWRCLSATQMHVMLSTCWFPLGAAKEVAGLLRAFDGCAFREDCGRKGVEHQQRQVAAVEVPARKGLVSIVAEVT